MEVLGHCELVASSILENVSYYARCSIYLRYEWGAWSGERKCMNGSLNNEGMITTPDRQITFIV